MSRTLPLEVDTLIVGSGPSALILSYILHGHIPVYDLSNPHPDAILHEKLKDTKDLLHLETDHVTEHFAASRISYSTQALPLNVLLDTLIRPHGETEIKGSCLKWMFDPSRVVSHIVVGDTVSAGGQWVDNPVKASWDIGTLSYAGMLSLPGYSFEEYYQETFGKTLPFYSRPNRREVAGYLSAYPGKVGIANAVFDNVHVAGIRRSALGFTADSPGITCKHLVLATGIFSNLIPPRQLLQPLRSLPYPPAETSTDPVLVVGSGFSAADVILSTPRSRSIIHIFKWNPNKHPSPLRACHQQAYPEYAGVYRRMKLAALSASAAKGKRPKPKRTASSSFDLSRDWEASYEGLPNTEIIDVKIDGNCASLTLRNDAQEVFERNISSLAYVVGRRGTLQYLDDGLRNECGLGEVDSELISGQTLREAANEDTEIAKDVFITGSLTGDSLIRFAFGSCVNAAGKIMQTGNQTIPALEPPLMNGFVPEPGFRKGSEEKLVAKPAMNGLDGHIDAVTKAAEDEKPLDRRKIDASG